MELDFIRPAPFFFQDAAYFTVTIDQIYILRKQKNTDREDRFLEGYIANPIYADVVFHLFSMVREYLSSDWGGKIADGLHRGYLI